MNNPSDLPDRKKLTVIYRVEHGCLGPQGKDHVDKFCDFAQKSFTGPWSAFIEWRFIPRNGISQPEIQYEINSRLLSNDKAEKYLEMFETSVEHLENHLHEKIVALIEQYMGRE